MLCIIEMGFLGQCVYVSVYVVCVWGWSWGGGGLSFYLHGCVHVCMCPICMCMHVCSLRLYVNLCVYVCVRGTDLFPHREDSPCLIREETGRQTDGQDGRERTKKQKMGGKETQGAAVAGRHRMY